MRTMSSSCATISSFVDLIRNISFYFLFFLTLFFFISSKMKNEMCFLSLMLNNMKGKKKIKENSESTQTRVSSAIVCARIMFNKKMNKKKKEKRKIKNQPT